MSPTTLNLVEIDSLTATIIIDNEIDVLSTTPSIVQNKGRQANIMASQPHILMNRGEAKQEIPMEAICCGAHGLSVLVTVTKDGVSHSLLFDTGPEGEAWERNATRLGLDIALIEVIQLSHWHRDHSGGMLRAISMITAAKSKSESNSSPVIIDLHPSRPTFRGFRFGVGEEERVVSMQADPSFAEIENAGGVVRKEAGAHAILGGWFGVSGEIPRESGYERGIRGGVRFDEGEKGEGKWVSDEEILDERFLMCNLKGKGIILFTGCSHGGVVNASRHSVDLLDGKVPLYAVLGGYHLVGEQEAKIPNTVRDLKALEPRVLLPGHCSGWRAKVEIEREMPGVLVPCTVGSMFVF
ncbi:metallo-beta-lactamase superfamily protein [Rhexocercosporidium sp. MPI-PUGE-AT-0058]|nr:metallo-beta-lactamase superfamily protein [Rhexocercosporidium sp. MPI-PUGE-AT-0058]